MENHSNFLDERKSEIQNLLNLIYSGNVELGIILYNNNPEYHSNDLDNFIKIIDPNRNNIKNGYSGPIVRNGVLNRYFSEYMKNIDSNYTLNIIRCSIEEDFNFKGINLLGLGVPGYSSPDEYHNDIILPKEIKGVETLELSNINSVNICKFPDVNEVILNQHFISRGLNLFKDVMKSSNVSRLEIILDYPESAEIIDLNIFNNVKDLEVKYHKGIELYKFNNLETLKLDLFRHKGFPMEVLKLKKLKRLKLVSSNIEEVPAEIVNMNLDLLFIDSFSKNIKMPENNIPEVYLDEETYYDNYSC